MRKATKTEGMRKLMAKNKIPVKHHKSVGSHEGYVLKPKKTRKA